MSLTVERVLQDPSHFAASNNCFFHDSCVACMLDERYRFLRWEGRKANSGDANLDQSHTRIFSSADQGATWALLTDFDVPLHTQWNELFSPGGNRLLAGTADKADYAYNGSFSLIPRSEDGGVTWTSAVSSGFFGSLTAPANTQRFVKLPNTTTVLAFGKYEVSGVPFNVLRSTDDGLTFTAFSDMGVALANHAAALSATEVVAVDDNGSAPMYSTDGGATWTAATKPAGATTLLFAFAAMGSGVVLAFGRTTSSNLGTIFRSTDSGQSYVTHALVGSETNRAHIIRALSSTVLIAGAGGPSPTILQKWWLSEDTGDTWSAAALVGDQAANSDSTSMTVTTQGFMLASLDRPTRAVIAADNKGEIWRGTVAGFSSGGVGTCEAAASVEPSPPVGQLGVHFLCIPTLSPQPCPQLCPADPVQPEGELVIPGGGGMPVIPVALGVRLACDLTFSHLAPARIYPTDPTQPAGQLILPGGVIPTIAGGGWRSVMTMLGLVNAPAVVPGPTGTLGLRPGCGATFANTNCAVAGC
jgi:BNR/Asp-box repeat